MRRLGLKHRKCSGKVQNVPDHGSLCQQQPRSEENIGQFYMWVSNNCNQQASMTFADFKVMTASGRANGSP